MSKSLIKILFSVALVCSLAVPAFAADTVKLGVAGAHAGELAAYGLPSLNAAKMAVDEVNAKGGVLGMQVEIIAVDDACKPELAPNAATSLISSGVVAVMGHICSGPTKASLPLYNSAKIISVSPSATTPSLTLDKEYPYFFRTIGHDFAQGVLAAEFVSKELGMKKVAILHDNGEYGKGYAETARDTLKQLGGVDIVLFEAITPGASDYSAVVRKIRKEGADSLVFGGYHPEASKIIANMRDLEIEIPMIGPDGLKGDAFLQLAGANGEGVYASGPKDTSANPMSKKVAAEHLARFNERPGNFFDNAYSATLAILNAINVAGSTETDKIVEALHNSEVDTPIGMIKFDDKGDAIGVGLSMYQIKDGDFISVFSN